ncbi:CheR family methyltransferase [Aquabacterium sp.]|uniref:CheR family methyltransferase n=1 Tax=Aquabacterium sp. TaxID=1872578 RepID=UPI003D6D2B67
MTPDSAHDVQHDEPLLTSRLDFPVVGLGASAGGLSTLQTFFRHMPAASGMAFVIVLHLPPKQASRANALLQSATTMPCIEVTDPVAIEPDHVYVIPPGKHLSMNGSHLRLTDLARPRGRHIAIDLFFRALATVHKERAVGIVLTGSGSDGAVGISAIKEHGGVAMAQSPEDAEFDSMPTAAIATGMIDWVMPVAEMPQKLLDMWDNIRRIQLPRVAGEALPVKEPPSEAATKEAEEALRDIMAHLHLRTGHDFARYKRGTVLRRLERRLQVTGLSDLPSYRDHLADNPQEPAALLKDLLIGVTNFFRDREAFEALEREVMPTLFREEANVGEAIRVWTAACATGEEAYSMAMLLCEQQAANPSGSRKIQVFATDIDEAAIAAGRIGSYPASIITDVPPKRLTWFFEKETSHYRVRQEVREKITFAAHNLLRDPPFSRLDLISCRNLLIYLDRDVRAKVLEMFHFALKPDGFLFLGAVESIDAASDLFAVVDKKNRIYRANANVASRPVRQVSGKAATASKKGGYAQIHQRLAEQYAPPSALTDAEANIVHLSEQAGRYLRQPGGMPTHHLLSLVQPALRLELRTAFFQALRTGKSVEARSVHLQEDGRNRFVNMIVRPAQETDSGEPLMLVLFNEVQDSMVADAQSGKVGRDPVVLQLEAELQRLRDRLQIIILQADSSAEEHKAANEELQAINEELRSATEELETSKEELQSVNEELITVNLELKMKVEETTKINDDLQNLIASTDIATVFIDRSLAIKRYTPRATQVFSIIPSDMGRPLLDINHRLNYQDLVDDAAEVVRSLLAKEREVSSNDGRWYMVRLLPYRTNEDRIDGAVLTFIDITSRREAEERLRLGEQRMQLVAESTRDHAIITTDVAGRIKTWNTGAERLFGYQEEQAIGQSITMLYCPEDRENGVPQSEMEQARDDGRSEDDRWHLRKDGSRFFCSGVTTPLYGDGVLQGFAKIARDLTGSKRAEHAREVQLARESRERQEAQAAAEAKDEFLAIMSHELKNPLNLIQLNVELIWHLAEARAVPEIAKAANTIRKTVVTQAKIIDDLLDLSRVNTGKLTLELAPVHWCESVRRIVDAVQEAATSKGVSVVMGSCDDVVVQADPVRADQIVWNLLNNAIKFTPSGGTVTVSLSTEDGMGKLEVQDTGKGIAPDFLPHIFQMFRQADSRTTRQEGGLGIGLALVQQLVHMTGGHVRAESKGLGKGSTFKVWLPVDSSALVLTADGKPTLSEPLRDLRMLMVDDDLHSLEAWLHLLTLRGAKVTTASSAAQALQTLAVEKFDVLVSDIAMPDMDGHELIRTVRAITDRERIPAIAVTGFGRRIDEHQALASGFDAHVGKPLSLERFCEVLLQVLPGQRPND